MGDATPSRVREDDGRRRKVYRLTDRGREAVEEWLRVLTPEPYMLRDLALLKLFFGADVGKLAEVQLETHRLQLAEFEALLDHAPDDGPLGPRLALELGIRHERETVRFWQEHLRTSIEPSP